MLDESFLLHPQNSLKSCFLVSFVRGKWWFYLFFLSGSLRPLAADAWEGISMSPCAQNGKETFGPPSSPEGLYFPTCL